MLAVATKVAKEEKDVTFVIIDIRTCGELKKHYRVGGLPALILFSNGTELSRVTGQRNAAALKDFMARGFLGKRAAFMKRPLAYTTNWIRSHFTTNPVCENE
jgi:thioredoxin-like negative regulator of GroEL